MRQSHSVGRVVTSFGIPTGAPSSVEAAWTRFNEVETKLAAARDALATAERNVDGAKQKDRDAAAQAIIAGTDTPPAKHEQKALAEVERQRQVLAATEHALDLVGDELAVAVVTHREHWVASASEQAEAASARFRDALATLRTEANALAASRGALNWLGSVEVIQEHPIGHVVVDVNSPSNDPLRLPRPAQHQLRMAAKATDLIDVLEGLDQ